MTVRKFGIGQSVRRVEDARLLRGEGRFTADLVPRGALAAAVLRSPHAHASFATPNVAAARAVRGVRAALTARDLEHLGDLPCGAPMQDISGRQMRLPPYPLLAKDVARHVGDAVALIVAERLYLKADALTRDRFEAAGCEPFVYGTRARRVATSFFAAVSGFIVWSCATTGTLPSARWSPRS
mgnify:CR=1 FL=1